MRGGKIRVGTDIKHKDALLQQFVQFLGGDWWKVTQF